jgi:hypothetical protein
MRDSWPPEPEPHWWNWWQASLDVVLSFVLVIALIVVLLLLLDGQGYSRESVYAEWLVQIAYAAVFGVFWLLARRRAISSTSLWSGWPDIPARAWPLLLTLCCIWIYLVDEFLFAYFE